LGASFPSLLLPTPFPPVLLEVGLLPGDLWERPKLPQWGVGRTGGALAEIEIGALDAF